METTKPPTTISVPYRTSHLEPLPSTSTDYKTEPLSLEMFNRAATNLNEKGVINLKRYKKYLHQHCKKLWIPAFMLGHLDPANHFTMEGLNMALATKLNQDGKPLPKLLFIDVMVEKTQKLIDHFKQFQLGLSLVANINENMATVKIFDNYATTNSQKLHVTISNLWDLEDQLYGLWIEVNRVIHDFVPELI